MNLDSHPTKTALKELLPDAQVYGGTFANSLPDIQGLSPEERELIVRRTRDDAIKAIESELIHSVDAKSNYSLCRSQEGYRIWPDGYTGSLSHKGTVVLAAILDTFDTRCIGIDVELDQNGGENLSHVIHTEEHPPTKSAISPALYTFSVKESVFKAIFPIREQMFDFEDVYLSWLDSSSSSHRGIATCPGDIELDFQCTHCGKWIVTIARLENHSTP